MKTKDLNSLLEEMDAIWQKFTMCRAFFAHMPVNLVGKKGQFKAPYYERYGHNVSLFSEKGLTAGDIERINDVGHYMNQNFIVRLFALLNSYQIVSEAVKIDQSIPGWEEIDILRRLRMRFAHSSGRYNPQDNDQKRLNDTIIAHFRLENKEYTDYVLSIDTVLEPLFRACKEYVRDFMINNGRE